MTGIWGVHVCHASDPRRLFLSGSFYRALRALSPSPHVPDEETGPGTQTEPGARGTLGPESGFLSAGGHARLGRPLLGFCAFDSNSEFCLTTPRSREGAPSKKLDQGLEGWTFLLVRPQHPSQYHSEKSQLSSQPSSPKGGDTEAPSLLLGPQDLN